MGGRLPVPSPREIVRAAGARGTDERGRRVFFGLAVACSIDAWGVRYGGSEWDGR